MNQRKIGALLSYATIGLQNLVGLLYTPYLLRMLGKSEYGLYSLVTSIISYLTLLDFGFGDAVVRYTAKFRAEGKRSEQYSMFGMFTILYFLISIVSVIFGIILSFNLEYFFSDTMSILEISRARIMLLCLVGNLAVTFFFSIYKAILDAYEQFVFVRMLNVFRIILNTLIMVILLQYGFKAVALVVVATILNVIIMILNFLYCVIKLKIHVLFKNIPWGDLKEIAGYSIFIFLNSCISHIYWFSGQFILGMYRGAQIIAVYAVSIQLVNMFKHFSTAISSVFFPKVISLSIQTESDREISKLFIRIGRLQYIIISLIISGFMVFGKEFIVLWAGSGYKDAYILTLIFFICLMPAQTQQIGWIVCKARNHLKFRTFTYVVIASLCLVAQVLGSKYYGMLGNVISIGGALVLMEGVILNIYYQKNEHIDIFDFWKNIIKLSLIPIILVILFEYIKQYIVFDSWQILVPSILIYSLLFMSLSYLLSFNNYERGLIFKKKLSPSP